MAIPVQVSQSLTLLRNSEYGLRFVRLEPALMQYLRAQHDVARLCIARAGMNKKAAQQHRWIDRIQFYLNYGSCETSPALSSAYLPCTPCRFIHPINAQAKWLSCFVASYRVVPLAIISFPIWGGKYCSPHAMRSL